MLKYCDELCWRPKLEAEIARLQQERDDAKDDALRLHRDKVNLWEKNFALRAVLEQIVKWYDDTDDSKDDFDVCEIARKALANEQKIPIGLGQGIPDE